LEKPSAETRSRAAVRKRSARAPIACCLALACASGPGLRQRADSIAADLQAARELRAETCAPKELATADANLRSARLAMEQGDSGRAESLLQIASPAAREALEKSKDCKTVAVREKAPEPRQAAPPVPAPAPSVSMKDTDGDGVPDVDDLCPDVAGPADRHGCPVFTDRDGDGVADDIDRCPELPGPKENFGCPWPDRDGDRVPDKDDKCPDEPGTPENQGCARKTTLIVVKRDRIELKQQIHFQPNRAVILKDSYEVLNEVAEALKQASNVTVRIEGHTDNVGKRSENLQLSQDRADSVKEYLVKEGVPAAQLRPVGYGQKRPIASNASRAGRTLNRRVEFRMEGVR
jgi:outer membrane protein OmpA-like peptidoglycan-associated protein